MGNRLIRTDCDPRTIAPGASTVVTVTYESDAGGPMCITGTDGFELKYDAPIQLEAHGSTKAFALKITREHSARDRCDLTFAFFGSTLSDSIKVTK
jgi:hypothetical protein